MDMDMDLMLDLDKLTAWRKKEAEWEETAVENLGPLDEDLEEYHDAVTLPNGYESKLKVIRPKAHARSSTSSPLIFLIHGGGFVAGSYHQLTRPGREFAKQFGAVVVMNTYRLAPEAQFPIQFEDCWETMLWLSANAATRFEADPEQGFVVGGASAGASIAAVIAQQAHEQALSPSITGSFITVPMLLVEEIVPERYKRLWIAREQNVPFPSVNKATLELWKARLKPDVTSPLFSPFNVPLAKLKLLPRTYVQVGDLDPLRDDGVLYERLLRENGVETRIDNYADLGHMTWSIFSDESHPDELGPNTMNAMAWLLRRE